MVEVLTGQDITVEFDRPAPLQIDVETILDSMLKKGQTQDVGDLAQQLIDMIQNIHKGTWSDVSFDALRMIAENPDGKWAHYTQRLIRENVEKFNEAKAKEHATMIRARQIALNLNLDMKIGDVEYQGDGNKAIFYYIADERVDFRQLIKVLAEAFRVRIEMKQIGARQEAGRIGGIGPCGRELCCATWMTSFVSVSTSAARFQDISLNPQKLAGQCAKLKC